MSKAGPFVPTSIPEWDLRGVVHRDSVGKIFEALFLAGATHLDVTPFIQGLAQANGSPRLPRVEAPALPAPKDIKGAKAERGSRASPPKYSESANEVIVKALRRRSKGMNYAAFKAHFLNLGRAESSVGANISHAKRLGLIVKDKDGFYTLVPGHKEKIKKLTTKKSGAKPSRAKYGSVRPEVMRVLQEAFPEGMAPFQISNRISTPHKMGAINSALAFFVDRKTAKRANGKYAAVKPLS